MSQRVSDERMEQIKDKNWCGTPIAVDLVDDLCDARKENSALKARLAAWETAPRIGIIIRTEGHADVSWYDELPPLNEVRGFAAIPSVPMSR